MGLEAGEPLGQKEHTSGGRNKVDQRSRGGGQKRRRRRKSKGANRGERGQPATVSLRTVGPDKGRP